MSRPSRRTKKPLASSAAKKDDSVTSNRSNDEASDVSMVDNDIIPSYLRAYKPGDPDDVRKIFKLGIPGYKAAKDHTPSRSTRKPGYYDKHLDKLLRPAKVAYCPGLNLQIEEIADRYYQKYIEKFGPPPKCDSTDPAAVRDALYRYGAPTVKVENGILQHYAQIIPDTILPIVSALAFETPSWWTRYMQWSTVQPMDKAIADAALRVDLDFPPPGSIHHDCPYSPVDQGNRRPPLGETAVQGEMSMFNCPVCDDPSMNELKDVFRYFPCVTLYEFKNLLAGSYEHMIAILEMTCDDDVHWEECDRQTCERDKINFRVTGSRTGFDAANPIVQLKAANWTKPAVDLEDDHRSSAKRILQQIWSEMVKNDATFLVLSCGNIDMIVARNRAEKVLYLGDPIFTTKPGYIQMLVGLFIASIRDAIDRAARLKACEDKNNLPLSWTTYTERHYRIEDDEPDMGPVDVGQILSECQELCLGPKKGSGSQYSMNLYKRYPQEQNSFGLEIKIRPIINDDRSIFIGTVKWKGKTFADCVIVKTAQGQDNVQELQRESCIFRSLMDDPQRCKIPSLYGFFVDLSNTDMPYAVILERYVGDRLSDKPSPTQRTGLKRTLEYVGERGYKYDKVKKRNIVVGTSKDSTNGEAELYLVGLSKVKPLLDAPESGDESDDEDTDLLSTLDREFRVKRRKINGLSLYRLGPISDNTVPPGQAFDQITTWAWKLPGQTTFPTTTRCKGWVCSLPDWLKIEVHQEDADKFEALWKRRPDAQKGIVCMKMEA
ncbi:hypothetical protein F5887DRAFT_1283198 [Amanita rubescens]|nr:hypothetical protein F5887DRAFT_1283198 [Amanita rubescens]